MNYVVLSNTLIGIGFLIMVANTARFCYEFIAKRDVWYGLSREWKYFTIAMALVLFAITVSYIFPSYIKGSKTYLGTILLINSVLVFVFMQWAINTVSLVKERGKDVARLLMRYVDHTDQNLSGHSLHVHYLTLTLFDHLPVEMKMKINRENLEFASLFHDLGKLSGVTEVTEKSGKLELNEWDKVKMHPELSVKALEPLPSFERLEKWIMYHHERPDGLGYYKLPGDKVPLASRIIAVCDVYSAITMERSYKATFAYDDAIAELKQVSGTQLDPELVEIFCNIPKEEIELCKEKATI